MKNIYFHNTIQKYIISMGDVFNDTFISFLHKGKKELLKVPLVYGNYDTYAGLRAHVENKGEKFLRGYNATPVMSFGLESIEKDRNRKSLNDSNYNLFKSEELNLFIKNRIPVPYNFKFKLRVWTRLFQHMGQILESILPYTYDVFSIRLDEFDNVPDVTRNIRVVADFDTVKFDFQDTMTAAEMENGEKQYMTDITFTLEGWLYFPISNDVGFINEIQVNYEDGMDANEFAQQYVKDITGYIDYMDLVAIEALKSNGAWETEREDGVVVLNDLIQFDNGEQYEKYSETMSNSSTTAMVDLLPTIKFTYTTTGNTVSFNNISYGDEMIYQWDFGDGNISNEVNPVHVYTDPGSYVVKLQGVNQYGKAFLRLDGDNSIIIE